MVQHNSDCGDCFYIRRSFGCSCNIQLCIDDQWHITPTKIHSYVAGLVVRRSEERERLQEFVRVNEEQLQKNTLK